MPPSRQTTSRYHSSMSPSDSQVAHQSDQVPRWRGSRPVAEPAALGDAPAVAAIPCMQGGGVDGTAEPPVAEAVPETASAAASRPPISPREISTSRSAALGSGSIPASSCAVGNAASDAAAAAAAATRMASAMTQPRTGAVSTAPRTGLHKTSSGICEVHL